MFRLLWEKISNSSHYTRSGLVVSAISFALIITFFCIAAPTELLSASIIIRIFATASLLSHLYSNATYIAGTIDLFQKPEERTKWERWLTLIGIVTGLLGGIIISLSLPSLTFFTFFSTTTVMTGAFAGLGSRFGGLKNRSNKIEQICLSMAAIIGCGMGFILTLTGTPIIHITGVISFVTCGSPLITSVLFIFLVTSLCMSGADYLSKSIAYLSNDFDKNKYHEYRGSFFGSFLSAAAIIFFVTHLHLLGSETIAQEGTRLAVATSVALFAKCFGIDGICSRIGRTLDRFFDKEEPVLEKMGKVLLVITGIAGLIVVLDMCYQFVNTCSRKIAPPLPQPNTRPSLNGSTVQIDDMLSDVSFSSDTSPMSETREKQSPEPEVQSSYFDYFKFPSRLTTFGEYIQRMTCNQSDSALDPSPQVLRKK